VRWVVLTIVCGGCGASLHASDTTDAATPDVAIDARPCAGGDNRATDSRGNCFVYIMAPQVWTAAKTTCAALPGHVAIVTSAEQNAVIDGMTRGTDAFLGATDEVTEGTFLWVDGSPLTYTHWRAGEPSNGGAGGTYTENCMVIEGRKTPSDTWDDRPCAPPPVGAGAYAVVCEYP
jgi:hypothetical protein